MNSTQSSSIIKFKDEKIALRISAWDQFLCPPEKKTNKKEKELNTKTENSHSLHERLKKLSQKISFMNRKILRELRAYMHNHMFENMRQQAITSLSKNVNENKTNKLKVYEKKKKNRIKEPEYETATFNKYKPKNKKNKKNKQSNTTKTSQTTIKKKETSDRFSEESRINNISDIIDPKPEVIDSEESFLKKIFACFIFL
ncbi:hypothetical protein CDIK_3497 [Cucumispora dikerogammari]|nr:hypothetical protein CDIK_3497 [Cucumispora dikerogammari]